MTALDICGAISFVSWLVVDALMETSYLENSAPPCDRPLRGAAKRVQLVLCCQGAQFQRSKFALATTTVLLRIRETHLLNLGLFRGFTRV
jgi:hypothetical protein